MKNWTNSSLGMYIDDGVIFACGREWNQIEGTMRRGYTECAEWLTRAGLNIEPDKTELIFFRRRGEKGIPPPYTHLPNYALQTYYRVPATSTIRYLGFHFDTHLNWSHHVNTVCNRARASLKALQLLGNSVRGLDQASWRLAYSAICLPVLTYGCQLWYTGKQITLVKKLQVVQNDAVRIISGTFRTTPRDPLHQLLTILPMDLRLDMLIKNTARRLYKAPDSSQLLRRLGPQWHTPSPRDFPLPTAARGKLVTTLVSLAARVPPGGPRINPFPDLPAGAPHWDGRLTLVPKVDDWDYTLVSEALTNSCHQGIATNIYTAAVLSNKDREDAKQLGAAAAVLYQEGRESGYEEKVFGEAVTAADLWTRALTPALDSIATHLADKPSPIQETFMILLPSNTALLRALDPSAHEEQEASLGHLRKLGELLTSYPNIKVTLQWLPRKIHFVGFRRAKQRAFHAIRTALPADLVEPFSLKKQKEMARVDAIAKWAEKWHQAPRTSMAYQTAIRAPPDGRAHHTFQPEKPKGPRTPAQAEQAQGQGNTVKFSRLTHSTFYRFVTGHAFTGEYTQRFYPLHTQDQIACPCGEPVQTIEHVLLHCPRYTEPRRRHLTAFGRPRALHQLFNKPERVLGMLRFLEETNACARPRERWNPG
jgi:hypothetical protein